MRHLTVIPDIPDDSGPRRGSAASWLPDNTAAPSGYRRVLARAGALPCPDCPCCSTELCIRARANNITCDRDPDLQPGTVDFDLARCPCAAPGPSVETVAS